MAKIVLIDDDSVLLKLYSTRLASDGHQVIVSQNGQEGLEFVMSEKPDLIVLDLLMPKVNGFTFIETINQYPELKKIPKIVFSSVANPDQIERLRQLGISQYLNKTDATPTQLVTLINQLVGKTS
jgi:CheY-like chemotaxis protein